jgi:uncharacterized membrane protein YciS (DUF1049 family)
MNLIETLSTMGFGLFVAGATIMADYLSSWGKFKIGLIFMGFGLGLAIGSVILGIILHKIKKE